MYKKKSWLKSWKNNLLIIKLVYVHLLWRSWLRHCATNRKVVGSTHDGFTGVFHSGRTTAQELAQRLTEMSTRNNP